MQHIQRAEPTRASANYLILLAFVFTLVSAQAIFAPTASASLRSDSCSALLTPNHQAEIDLAFKEVFDSIYSPDMEGLCSCNVNTLFRELRHKLPFLKYDDFKVLFITPPNYRDFSQDYFRIDVKNYREVIKTQSPRYVNDTKEWNYHVVLLYQNRVYDLDYGNQPKPVSIFEYFADPNYIQEMSRAVYDGGDRGFLYKKQLRVIEIPGGDYLWLTEAQVKASQISKNKEYKFSSIEEYLASKTESEHK